MNLSRIAVVCQLAISGPPVLAVVLAETLKSFRPLILKASAVLISPCMASMILAEEASPTEMPSQLKLTETLEMGSSWQDLKRMLPQLGEAEHLIPSAKNLTSASDTFSIHGIPFSARFEFDDGKLYGWGASASNKDTGQAIAVADRLLAHFEERLGPSVREVGLPFEHDGPRDSVSTGFLWNVKGREFSLSLDFQPGSARVSFGAYHALVVSGNYFIADPFHPLRGLLGGRSERTLREVEVVGSPGAAEKLHVLTKLHERGVTGSRPKRARGLADFGQTIELFGGKFIREEDRKPCLRLEWFRVRFPITLWRKAKDGTAYAEVHFSMKSLFPEGIELEGKAVDLKAYEEWDSSQRLSPPRGIEDRDGEQADSGNTTSATKASTHSKPE